MERIRYQRVCKQQSNEQANTSTTKNCLCKPILQTERDNFVIALLAQRAGVCCFFPVVTLIPRNHTFAIR